jgi:hypothetical protein
VKYINNDSSKGALITVQNLEQMAMPVVMKIQQQNGKTDSIVLPAEIWQRGDAWTFSYHSTSAIKSIVIDPNHEMPEINPDNIVWPSPLKPIPAGVSTNDVITKYIKAIGGFDKLKSVSDYTETDSERNNQSKSIITYKYKLPDKFSWGTNRDSLRTIVNGDTIRDEHYHGPVTDKDRKIYQEYARLFPELSFFNESYKAVLTGLRTIDGKDAYEIKVVAPSGTTSTYYYEVTTGYKIKEISNRDWSDYPDTKTSLYADYRDVHGIKIPYSVQTDYGWEPIKFIVKSIDMNTGLSDTDFK